LRKSRRSQEELLATILRIAKDGAKKTHLVYQSNMNFKVITPFINHALTKGFMIYNEDVKLFNTTDTGIRFIEAYDTLEAYMDNESTLW